MSGYFQLVNQNETYKDKIWPIGQFTPNEIAFLGDTSNTKLFKVFGIWCKSVHKTLSKYPESERNFYLNLLGLMDDERIRERKWNQLGFSVRWRATLVVALLEGKQVFSLPDLDFTITYYALPVMEIAWQYLLKQDYVILVPANRSSWINPNLYPVKAAKTATITP